MPTDFSSKQIRVSQIMASGSIAGKQGIGLVIYSASNATSYDGAFPASMIAEVGSDTFLFVSGSKGAEHSRDRKDMTVFGGDVLVSGTLYAERQVIEVDESITGSLTVSGSMFVSQSARISKGLEVNASRGSAGGWGGDDLVHFGSTPGREIFASHASTNRFLILSGGAASSPNEGEATDLAFFVSGTIGSRNTTVSGVSVFGGDLVVSGVLLAGGANFHKETEQYVGGTISGSIHHTSGGISYIAHGTGISVASSSNGQIVIGGTYTAGAGLELTGDVFATDLKASGGLKIVATELAVEPSDFAGTGLEDDGSDNLRIAAAAAGVGLAGGGGSALSLDVSELSALGATADVGDYVVIQDSTDNSTKKVLVSNLPGDIQGVTAGTGLDGGGTSGTVTLNLDVNELSALGTTADNADYLVLEDATDNSTKKVLVSNLPGGAVGWTDDGTVVRLTTATDHVGIGTNTPAGKLHIKGVSGEAVLIENTYTHSASIGFLKDTSTGTESAIVYECTTGDFALVNSGSSNNIIFKYVDVGTVRQITIDANENQIVMPIGVGTVGGGLSWGSGLASVTSNNLDGMGITIDAPSTASTSLQLTSKGQLTVQAQGTTPTNGDVVVQAGNRVHIRTTDAAGAFFDGHLVVQGGDDEMEVVINEDQRDDVSFRVESDTSAHALYVDPDGGLSGAGEVHIGGVLNTGWTGDFNVHSFNRNRTFFVDGQASKVGILLQDNQTARPNAEVQIGSGLDNLPVTMLLNVDSDASASIAFQQESGATKAAVVLENGTYPDFVIVNSGSAGSLVFKTEDAGNTHVRLEIQPGPAGDQVLFLSGGAPGDKNPKDCNDIALWVSGSIHGRNKPKRGVAAFGGDVVVSGSFYLEELAVTPGVVPDGTVALYGKDDSGVTKLYFKNEDGETEVGAGGGGSPGGLSTQIQYNDGGVFSGTPAATTNGTIVTFSDTGILVGEFITHTGDADTQIQFETDTITLRAGNVDYIKANAGETALSINPDGLAINTLIKSNNKMAFAVNGTTDQVLILSGGAAVSYNEAAAPDVNFFVSGSIGSSGSATRGTSVFGGDMVVSGALGVAGGTSFHPDYINIGTGGWNPVTIQAHALDINALSTVSIDSLGGLINIGTEDHDFNISIGTDGARTVALGNPDGAIQIDAGAYGIRLDSTAGVMIGGGSPSYPLDVQAITAPVARFANISNNAFGGLIRLENTRGGNNGVAEDFAGGTLFFAQDSAGNATQYAKLSSKIISPANGGEVGSLTFETTTQLANKGTPLYLRGDRVHILSGGAPTAPDESAGADVGFYVSGSQSSMGTGERGTSVFGGDVVVSGSLIARQLVATHHAANLPETTQEYIPFNGTQSEGSPAFNSQMVKFAGGMLKSVMVRAASAGGPTTVGFHKESGTNATVSLSATETQTVTMSAGQAAIFDFTSSTYAPGNIVGISINPTTALDGTNIICIWEDDFVDQTY